MTRVAAFLLTTIMLVVPASAGEPTSIPKEFYKNTDYLVGDWRANVQIGDKGGDAKMSVEWIPGKYGYIIKWEGPADPFPSHVTMTLLGGWDAGEKVYKEVGFDSAGGSYNLTYRQKSPSTFEGEGKGVQQGKPFRFKIFVDRTSKDEFVWKTTDSYSGDKKQPNEVVHYRRVAFAKAPEQSKNLLQEYGELVVGRWIGDVTLVTDWPGIGKKGEKIVNHVAVRWIADRKGLEDEGFGGNGTGKSIYFWNPASKKIRNIGVDSGGTVQEAEIWKEGDKWMSKGWGHLADGTKTEGKTVLTAKDNGNTIIIDGEGTAGGKKMLPLHDVYRRASK